MKILLLSILSVLVCACSTDAGLPESKTISKVSIPAAPKAPDVAPVEDSMRRLDSAVAEAKQEMDRAEDTLNDSKRMSDNLRQVVDQSFEEADEVAQVALKSIREAASTAAERLDEVSALLSAAGDKLEAAEYEAKTLEIEVSTLKVDLALETSHVVELQKIAATANERVDEANAQKDEFQNALTFATSAVETAKAEAARVKGHRFKLGLLCVLLLMISGGLAYLIFKI